MKKQIFFVVLGVMLLLIPGALWAGHQPGVSPDTPAILVSLGQANAIPLDDSAAAAVRGSDSPTYMLVKVFGLNMFDTGAAFTWNLLGYRYGWNGGVGWSHLGETPVDAMDTAFGQHDFTGNDAQLLTVLAGLPYTTDGTYSNDWGQIYVTSPTGLTTPNVSVFGISLIGGKVFRGWKAMPYTEYSRREAVYGMQLLILGKSILKIN